jgi:protein phosphatase
MRWEQQVQYASLSDVGFRRRNNQDSSCVRICSDQQTWHQYGHLFMVADGMGGHAVGELASKIAADTIPHTFFKTKHQNVNQSLKQAIEVANSTIHERGTLNREFERMGTTCTALVLSPKGAVIGHVGDSRVYRIRGERIDQLTFDHSLQWELLKLGRLKPEEIFLHQSRHVITRSLGPDPVVEVDIEGPFQILPGDTYVVCSDGLTGHVHDAEIGMIARELPPGEACRLLVSLANLRGGSDNVTVVAARVGDVPEGVSSADDPSIPPPQNEGLNWWWLAGFWGVAMTVVMGLSLLLFNKFSEGLMTTSVAVVAVGALLLRWLRIRPQWAAADKTDETTLWKPYRTASAKFDRQLLTHLAALESELQRTASDEQWPIDWSRHESAYQSAKSCLDSQQYVRAFSDLAKAIDVLMAGVLLYRKQMHHAQKWGENPLPANKTPP